MTDEPKNEEWVEIKGKKYRVDGEFHISEDEMQIFYRGVKYNWFNNYYRRHHFSKEIPSNLHRAVWIDHFGPIPDGYHIHHKDGNRRNNHIENLQMLDQFTHLSRSAKKGGWVGSEENLKHLVDIRDKTKKWHASEEGLKWHREHGIRTWENRKTITNICEHCGKKYEAWFADTSKYCHNNCKSKARRKSGVDNENRQCSICQKYFVIDRYKKTKTCSRSCAAKLREKTKRH